jgi:hypothetical protein
LKQVRRKMVNPIPTLIVLIALTGFVVSTSAGEFRGEYVSGKGDAEYLRLIDESFGYFHPNPNTPNISMLYYPEWDCLIEGFPTWMAWWIQNSYGPTYCSLPFLQEPWLSFLQHAQDMWFNNQGDGKKGGYAQFAELIGPEGALCDAAVPDAAIYRQGDYNWHMHDWAFEFTAAGVVMQAELLLVGHDKVAARKYLPNLERACNFIETRRDPKNGLFLAGPAANLLAPSYGGIKQPDGTFGMGYLAGLSVNYLAACDRMVELWKLVGDKEKVALYESRRKTTKDSLPLLMAPGGYFIKSMETDGTKHGVYGHSKYGYFEVAPNVDAICFRAVDQPQSETIYGKIASIPQLRPHDFLITNYPSLDDTYVKWGSPDPDGLFEYGRWVNGGFWATMEARAIMAYYRLGKYDDVRKSNRQLAKFTRDYQMDAPLTDFGNDVWFKDRLTNLCYDTLGIPAATVRGLFEYVYKADSLILYPHIPPSIAEYSQKVPIRFGEKRLTISVRNGGPTIESVKVNGITRMVDAPDHIILPYSALPKNARIDIVTKGTISSGTDGEGEQGRPEPVDGAQLPESLQKPYEALSGMQNRLSKASDADYEKAFLTEALRAFEAYRTRGAMVTPQFTPEKRAAVMKMYEDAALNMYKGFDGLMKRYSTGDEREKRMAEWFAGI